MNIRIVGMMIMSLLSASCTKQEGGDPPPSHMAARPAVDERCELVKAEERHDFRSGCGEESEEAFLYFTPWRVATPVPLSPEDLRTNAFRSLRATDGDVLEFVKNLVSKSEEWQRRSEAGIVNGRFLVDVRIQGGTVTLFADQFVVCNLSLDRCADVDSVFRDEVAVLFENIKTE